MNDIMTMPSSSSDGVEAYPVISLIEELRSDDPQTRLNSVQQLEYIALALGPSRTRNELLPYVFETLDEDDRVLSATATRLSAMIDSVGGPEHASHLLRPLEDMLGLEEATVRDKALESMKVIISHLPKRLIESLVHPLVHRLATNEWFAVRIAACGLIPVVAAKFYTDELLRTFLDLCSDDTPMVRRSGISNIGSLAHHVPQGKERDLLDALRRLARDDQESVRILTIPTAMQLAREVFPDPQDSFNALFPEIRSCVDDASWRVRVTVGQSIHDVLEHTPSKTHQQVFELYIRLLNDSESEVRAASANNLAAVAGFRPDRQLITLLTPSLIKLVRDDSELVRGSFAEGLTKASPIFGPEITAESLLGYILKLLRDQSTAVRLRVLGQIDKIAGLNTLDEINPCLIPAILELASDRQWRVRLAVLEITPNLATELGDDVFIREILPTAIRWLCDPVFSVRSAAAVNMKNLIPILSKTDFAFFQTHLLPQLTELAGNSNFLFRISVLMVCAEVADILGVDTVVDSIVPLVLSLLNDPVANVRYRVVKTLRAVVPRVDADCRQMIQDGLKSLSKDNDADVVFFAKEALT